MNDWHILITDGLNESGKDILRQEAQVDDRRDIEADELMHIIHRYHALVVRGRTKVTPDLLSAAKQLKVIGRAGVGVDNINLQAAREHHITVVNAPQSTTLAVAELTLTLLLSVARAAPMADRSMKNGEWIKKQLEGVELNGKTLGVIGLGNIGRAVAHRAQALGMAVVAYDIVTPQVDDWVRLVSLETLYAQSDFITIHVPLSDQTRGMVDRSAIASMKRGVRLVCTARGGIIDEIALLEALNSGQVAAAGLDVFAKEPTGLTELVAHPHVVATPHIGAQTEEAQARAGVDIANEVMAALRGEELRWKVA